MVISKAIPRLMAGITQAFITMVVHQPTYLQLIQIFGSDFVINSDVIGRSGTGEMQEAICIRLIVDLWSNYGAERCGNNATGFVYGDTMWRKMTL